MLADLIGQHCGLSALIATRLPYRTKDRKVGFNLHTFAPDAVLTMAGSIYQFTLP